MTDPLLTIRDLRIEGRQGRSWTPIVKGVDLELKRGEILGLIGESGAGKSTLGLAAMGYARDGTRISGGSIDFDGQDLLALSERRRRGLRGRRIAYVAQSAAANFNPAHRLIRQFSEAPTEIHRIRGRDEAEAEGRALYARMRLPNPGEIGFRYPHQVSGGQLQRAMTAMAMSCRPDLIIFDEPTTALDVTTQIEVLAAIRDAVREFGTAAIYITHDLAVVAQMADRIKILRHGEEVEEQPTRAMLSAPREDYSKSLWAVRSHEAAARPAPAEGETPVLRLSKVSAEYVRGTRVLRDVSFDIPKGRTVAVVGESGSGKSTTARVLTGLLPLSAGQVELDGAPLPDRLAGRSKDQLRQIQMIYQMADTALNPKQTIREIIGRPLRFYLGLRGAAQEARIRELLAAIELDPDSYIDRLPGALSGGQKQRIGIARALAAEPKLIVCDEVTSALDQLVANGILRLLRRLQEERGLSYMFITHDLATVRAIADHVVVMQNGEVVEQGPRDEMFAPPHHPYTETLLASVPQMDADWLDTALARRGEI
ncbi:ABC transporter ATP-binding protein (plasmid) [Limimaricola variabilis]|uniref:ABC transporter ATP-binding protein n=1 Tax=Limimaricola variabilis TaxID=1492771 RepID=UPI002AC971DE|nr:ABC transporter ATP-binding protein [Limimaricola variabilis]WPY96434.1 ABC transporter ATP-binding protein [Limimaricola variabilis]